MESDPINIYLFISPVATLIAAFAGAWLAFLFNARTKKDEIVKQQVAAANKALFTLHMQLNSLIQLQEEVIDPVRDNPLRSIVMRPILGERYEHLGIDYGSLSFLLETKHAELLLHLSIQEERFNKSIITLNSRSELHLNEIQPLFEKAGIKEGEKLTKEKVEAAIGSRLYHTVERNTMYVIEIFDITVESLKTYIEKLRSALEEIFPKKKFIHFKS